MTMRLATACCRRAGAHRWERRWPKRFTLLQMALGTCAISTKFRVARDEHIPAESTEIDVSYKLDRIDESATTHYSVTLGLRITEVIERILVSDNIDADQLATLFRGAGFCPVSNKLAVGVPIRRKIALAAPSQQAGQGR